LVPRLPRKILIFLAIVVVCTTLAVVTTAMPPAQPRQASTPAATSAP
jgi:hypothetical protein